MQSTVLLAVDCALDHERWCRVRDRLRTQVAQLQQGHTAPGVVAQQLRVMLSASGLSEWEAQLCEAAQPAALLPRLGAAAAAVFHPVAIAPATAASVAVTSGSLPTGAGGNATPATTHTAQPLLSEASATADLGMQPADVAPVLNGHVANDAETAAAALAAAQELLLNRWNATYFGHAPRKPDVRPSSRSAAEGSSRARVGSGGSANGNASVGGSTSANGGSSAAGGSSGSAALAREAAAKRHAHASPASSAGSSEYPPRQRPRLSSSPSAHVSTHGTALNGVHQANAHAQAYPQHPQHTHAQYAQHGQHGQGHGYPAAALHSRAPPYSPHGSSRQVGAVYPPSASR